MEISPSDHRRKVLKRFAAELDKHGKSAAILRGLMAATPPDELSKTDLLALRAGMLRNLDTHVNVTAATVRLLNKLVDSLDAYNDS